MAEAVTLKVKEKKEVRCEYCLSKDNRFMGYRGYNANFSISKKDTFGIYRCNNCNIYFNFPRPTEEELRRFFEEEYHAVRYQKRLQDVLKGYPKRGFWTPLIMCARRYAKKILARVSRSGYVDIENIIRKHLGEITEKRPTVLEIGPGQTPLLYLAYTGYDYTGVEPAKEIVSIFNRRGYQNIRQGHGENLDFIDKESVDAVIFIGTLDHVSNLKKVFDECRRVLKKRGILLIVDANVDNNNINNIKGSYNNYGFPKIFLARSVEEFELKDYFYMDNQKLSYQGGSKMLAVLKRKGKVAIKNTGGD